MARAVMVGRCVRGARLVMTLACLVAVGCTSGGKDRSFSLPDGEEFDAVRSDKVLVVVEAQNECTDGVDCVPAPSGPCHLGNGNTRGLALYRLGSTGLLQATSPDGPQPEQVIATDTNPRRVVVNPTDPTLVYVATRNRVQVIRLRSGGGSSCIDETSTEQDVRPDADDLDAVDLVVDPRFGNGILYVAGRGSNRIDAYPIADDGTLPTLPTSCIVGGSNSEFASASPLGDGFFAAGGSVNIEIHARVEGQFLPEPDPNASPTATPIPTVSPTPAAGATPEPGETPGPSVPSPEPSTCIDARLVSTPLSVIGSAIVTDMLFEPSTSAPLGQLFLTEEASERIFTFRIDADGVVQDDDSSDTKRAGLYQRMLRRQHGTDSILYATVFNEGRVDVFRLEDGLLPNQSFSRTAEDPDALPVAMAVDDDFGNILYVAQGGLDRIDGFRILADGGLADEPATSTASRVDDAGNAIDTFPDDVAIVTLP